MISASALHTSLQFSISPFLHVVISLKITKSSSGRFSSNNRDLPLPPPSAASLSGFTAEYPHPHTNSHCINTSHILRNTASFNFMHDMEILLCKLRCFKSLYKCLMIVMALIASVSYVSINFQDNRLQSNETLIHVLSQDIKVPYFGQKI